MILEIRLRNFFSIKDEIVLDLRAGNIKNKNARDLSSHTFSFNHTQEVLKTVALYGANASGKSNIVKAIRLCSQLVLNSHNHNENSGFDFKPFKFDSYDRHPAYYLIRFVINDIEYEYSFSLTPSVILEEQLYYYPQGKRKKIFTRNESLGESKRDKYSFGPSLIKRPYDVADSTSQKTLYISRASQMDREIPKQIFHFFNAKFILSYLPHNIDAAVFKIETYKDQLLQALQLADLDIVDFKTEINKGRGKNVKLNLSSEQADFEETEMEHLAIYTYHKQYPKTPFNFFEEESDGTRKLFDIMLTILHVAKNNGILLVDEIEQHLHPTLVEHIINIFNASDKAQLIFTTHNTRLLDLKKTRKDQILFVNKREDASTELYSLYDFRDFRETMDLEKAYLSGRFDAIPIIDNSENRIHSLING